jgi:hypothetical protein
LNYEVAAKTRRGSPELGYEGAKIAVVVVALG